MLSLRYLTIITICLTSIAELEATVTVSDRSSKTYFLKQSQLMRNGFTYIFYNYTDSNDLRSINVSSKCISSLKYIYRALTAKQDWPLTMFDASGRFPLDSTGTGYSDFGHFDKCLDVEWSNNETQSTEVGQHCMTSLLPTVIESEWKDNLFTRKKPIHIGEEAVFKIGFCIPSGCSQNDFENILIKVLEPYEWHLIKVDRCSIRTTFTDRLSRSSLNQKIALTCLICIGLFAFYATWLDWSSFDSTNQQAHWSHHFSLIKSYNDLVKHRPGPKETFLTILGIAVHIVGTTFHVIGWWIFAKGYALFGNTGLIDVSEKEWFKLVKVDYIVEMLFFYGALVRSMNLWRVTGPSTSLVSSFSDMARKMIYILIIQLAVFTMTMVVPLIVTGPMSSIFTDRQATCCEKSFWSNILFWQNNYRPIFDGCLPHFWTVAIEFQILPVNIALVHLYKRVPGVAFTLNTLIVSSGLIYTGISAYYHDLVPRFLFAGLDLKMLNRWFSETHFPTSMHIWSYTTGPLWTYLIMTNFYQRNNFLVKLTGSWKTLIVIFACLHIMPQSSVPFGSSWNGIYFVLSRLLMLLQVNFCVMMGADSMRQFFAHPQDKKDKNFDNNNTIDNGLSTGNQQIKHQIIHILSTSLRSIYYIHVVVILMHYTYQRWPVVSVTTHIFTSIENYIWILIGGFIFHFFIASPLDSLCAIAKFKRKEKVK